MHEMELPGELNIQGVSLRARLVVTAAPTDSPQSIEEYRPELISLAGGNRILMGSQSLDGPLDIFLPKGSVSTRHCVLVRQPPHRDHYWIVDCASPSGTFVNREPIAARRIQQSDLVQVGPYAWVFDARQGSLVPVRKLSGVGLSLNETSVGRHLKPVSLQIEPGQLVAIVGPSGSGKSTLVRALLEGGYAGRIEVDGQELSTARAVFRRKLGYVSQKAVVHEDLTAREAVEFSARLRGATDFETRLDRLFGQLELSNKVTQTQCRKVSGGEMKRIQTAAELINEPTLLILDEPASGLDRQREQHLMRLLRTLSYRGCTIIVVTHGLRYLKDFDRVLALSGGVQVFWGTVDELRHHMPSDDLEDLDLRHLPATVAAKPAENVFGSRHSQHAAPPAATMSMGRQILLLLQRELALLRTAWWSRLAVPLAALPLFFALAIGVAVEPTKLALLGFLSILAAIWMGGSLSHMSIVDERNILEHERLLFLRVPAYVVAKTATLWGLAAMQTWMFLVLLCVARRAMTGSLGGYEDTMLFGIGWCALTLTLVSWAAVGLGLLISALAGTSRLLAGSLLPLAMMAQIVFSVQVADSGGSDSLIGVYGKFNANGDLPNRWAAISSYATISRYGDILLRSFAYDDPKWDPDKSNYPRWRIEASCVLIFLSASLPAAVIFMLSRHLPRHR